jgi:hypothetical protein
MERKMYTVEQVLSKDETYRYNLLSRMKADCEYFLGNGGGAIKYLWGTDVDEQIRYMKAIYIDFPDDKKPEWLSYEDILRYERKMKMEFTNGEID